MATRSGRSTTAYSVLLRVCCVRSYTVDDTQACRQEMKWWGMLFVKKVDLTPTK